MENIHKKFIENLVESEKHWGSADHLIYITYPVVGDAKLILRAFESLYKSLVLNVSTILKFEYLYKRISLGKNRDKNLNCFFKKCAERYGLDKQDIGVVKEIIFLGKKHKESSVEFSKRDKIVILDEVLGNYTINIDKMKNFISVSRKLLENTNRNFRKNF